MEHLGVHVTTSNLTAAESASHVFLAVKPQVVPTVLKEISGALANKLVISIAAGRNANRLLLFPRVS